MVLGMVVHTYDLITQEAVTWLHNEILSQDTKAKVWEVAQLVDLPCQHEVLSSDLHGAKLKN